ncbi:unnamed protein product [Ambrosiozyma monospora]|uniref:Unnamed protein product n=1 Tax=Ambrosiozyma monospora TaxID=43982 RepID=A0A9W7DKK1_AMBMO|nr:unnamed protein product [Ambrosiozyma monospora]
MSTNQFDHKLIQHMKDQCPDEIIANYGIHPWFSHLFTFDEPPSTTSSTTTQSNQSKTQDQPEAEGEAETYKHTEQEEQLRHFKLNHYTKILTRPKSTSLDQFHNFINLRLPTPIYFPDYMRSVIEPLLINDQGAGVGEIGLDKSFRIPNAGYFGKQPSDQSFNYHDELNVSVSGSLNHDAIATSVLPEMGELKLCDCNCTKGKEKPNDEEVGGDGSGSGGDSGSGSTAGLTPYRVSMDHQVKLFIEFLDLAERYGRPVSVHCVKAQGTIYEILHKRYGKPKKIKGNLKDKTKKHDTETNEARGDNKTGNANANANANGKGKGKGKAERRGRFKIEMHSFSGSLDQMLMYLKNFPCGLIYFSISHVLNLCNYKDTLVELFDLLDDEFSKEHGTKRKQGKPLGLSVDGVVGGLLLETDLSLDRLILGGYGDDADGQVAEGNEHLKLVELIRDVLLEMGAGIGLDDEVLLQNFKRFIQ